MKRVRCAIYTRKSSDEGLEQSFNSLDAQREACSAYILSQASEGWVAVADSYDDGGLSGGTLARPALQRLLADVAAGQIDIIVVYKVDRLTRSLLDFAKLVEAFDGAGTSFVSVTQSFNTTTSMGRLTLNMLLSFAQFEREVTAERIRDKIAASKAKGMWMGGIPPLGYQPDGRSLAVVEDHAGLVRTIFERYLALGSVTALAEALTAEGVHAPARSTATGKRIGGVPFSRGQLYLILKNRTYLGQIEHKGSVYPGLHAAIVEAELWERAQALLAGNTQGVRSGPRHRNPSPLAGLITDGSGTALIATHATTHKRRYRYYASKAEGEAATLRIPAREIESAVAERIATLFGDPLELAAAAQLTVPADCYADVALRAQELAARLRQKERAVTRELVTNVTVKQDGFSITLDTQVLARALSVSLAAEAPETLTLAADVRLTRSGRVLRLVHDSGAPAARQAERSLTRLLATAHRYWRELKKGEINVTELAAREQVSAAWVTRVLRLAFLAPDVTGAILDGRQRGDMDAGSIVATGAVEPSWEAQRLAYLPRAN